MTEKTARIIGGDRGTGLAVGRALAGAGLVLADPAATGPADRVVLMLDCGAGSFAALAATVLEPFHAAVSAHAAPLRESGGSMLVVLLLPPGAGLWQQIAADWIAAAIVRCAADWRRDGSRIGPGINGLVAVLDDSTALPRFLAPRPAAPGQVRPAEVAAMAAMLCADSAGGLSGQVLHLGQVAR